MQKKSGGGLGVLVQDSVVVIDDNVNNSKVDELERLRIQVKVNNVKYILCLFYFPCM